MNVIDTASLVRGATIIDCAFSERFAALAPTVPELVGMVAAYAGRGKYPLLVQSEADKELGDFLTERMALVLDLFNDWDGKSLWHQGPAYDDFHFTDKTLAAVFPQVNEAYRLASGKAA